MMNLTKVFCSALLLVVAGCASKPMQIKGLEFVNETGMPVVNVKLRIVETYEMAACSYIAPAGKFSTQFPLKEYKGKELEVRWSSRAGEHRFGPEVIESLDPVPEKPVMAVVVFHPAGRAEAYFREE